MCIVAKMYICYFLKTRTVNRDKRALVKMCGWFLKNTSSLKHGSIDFKTILSLCNIEHAKNT